MIIWLHCVDAYSRSISEDVVIIPMDLRDKVVPVLGLLQSTESHLCARDVLLWVLQVLELRVR